MYLPFLYGFISLLQQFRPYFRKHISYKLEHHEYLFLNSLFVTMITCIYLVYLFVIERTSMEKIIDTFNILTLEEYIFIIALSILTIVSSIFIYEMDKNHNTPFLNNLFIKSSGILALIFISIFMFNESYKPHQFVGILFILLGIYLASTKKLLFPF
jgi:drug/metabolite transporter (DMT)-like permease